MLSIKDFAHIAFDGEGLELENDYFSFTFKDYEICLEPCLSGYCVGIYVTAPDERIAKAICEPKRCADFKFKNREGNLTFGVDGLKNGEANMVLLRAMKFANEFYKKYNN